MTTQNNEVCIVVVLFNPKEEQIYNVEALSARYTVVAIDNSEKASSVFCSFYVPLFDNKGIAAAQNVGIQYAKDHGFNYVLLLDQDSCISDGFVEGIVNDFKKIKEKDGSIGYLGPIFIDRETLQEYKNYTDKSKEYTEVSEIIASGALLSMKVIGKVGMMEDDLFIDLVDFEWCWRAKRLGFSGYMTRNIKLIHSIGCEYHNWHGFVLGISAPFRYYYQYRNTIWLCKRDYIPFGWKVKSVLRGMLDIFLVPIVSNKGKLCLRFIMKGIKAGLFNKE